MAHPAGERLRCETCGAEIVYVQPCNCPPGERKTHQDVCCGKDMRAIDRETGADDLRYQEGPRH